MARTHRLAAALVVALTVASCSSQNTDTVDTPPPPNLDPPVSYTSHWTSPPEIDLFSREAELVRVSVEAGWYAMAFGVDGEYADYPPFPGYAKAIGAPHRNHPNYFNYYYADTFGYADSEERAMHYHIIQMASDGANIDALVCGYQLLDDPTTNPHMLPVAEAVQVRLSNPDGHPGLPGIPDTDPDTSDPRAHFLPSWNVFGNWKIDTLMNSAYDRDRDTFSDPCTPWWQEQFPTFAPLDGSRYIYPPDDYVFPTAPADRVQYPEWIGPSDPS